MIVAAHQPHYLPWLGYLHRIQQADLFVIVDHVQFERQNYQNRTRSWTAQGVRWLIVPLYQRSRDERLVDKLVNNQRDGRLRWGRKTYLTLEHAYHHAPHFADYAPTLKAILDRPWEKLVDLNLELLKFLFEAFDITTPTCRSSDLALSGRKSDMVLQLCQAVKADVYLSGNGASRRYLEVDSFQRAGIDVIWQQFQHPVYRQHSHRGEFIPGLSALDLLFNCGPESRHLLGGPPLSASSTAAAAAAPM